MDESQFYLSKYNVGRRLGTEWFFGGIKRGYPSKIFLFRIPNRKAETPLPIIRDKTIPETTIISDSWRLDLVELWEIRGQENDIVTPTFYAIPDIFRMLESNVVHNQVFFPCSNSFEQLSQKLDKLIRIVCPDF
ncbi:hypothetical protein RF11_04104 [Thelohanellus kitauei]|uniref:ISXO2-like transposase domain-containing protein n=1 Tax=Thelohanellus kitauei TaxID=669202 RepID=A0A0C2MW09_THEKT|nr:hypothetical protein RF11_04104 [Thelohanellus kitauei]